MDTKQSECSGCGQFKRQAWKDCPALSAECRKCHKKGHFAKKCRSANSVHHIAEAQSESREGDDFAFLGVMWSVERKEWNETLQLNGEKAVFKLDTGVCVTAITSSMYM